MKPTYKHSENGITICTLRDKSNNVVHGYAYCHPDEPQPSERVGEYIATIRAEIKYYKLIRKIELRPQMKALGHVYACIKNTNSKLYDGDSPEAQLIWRQYNRLREDCEVIGELITELQNALNNYLADREKYFGQKEEN